MCEEILFSSCATSNKVQHWLYQRNPVRIMCEFRGAIDDAGTLVARNVPLGRENLPHLEHNIWLQRLESRIRVAKIGGFRPLEGAPTGLNVFQSRSVPSNET